MRFKFKCDLSKAVAHGALKSGFMAFAGVNGSCTEAELKGLEACQHPFGRRLRTRLFYRCVDGWAGATGERAEVGTSQFLLVTTLHVHVLAAVFGQTRLDAPEGVTSDWPWTACTIPRVTQFQDHCASFREFDELVPDTEGDPMFAELDLDLARGRSWSRAIPPAESGIVSGGEVETRPNAERDAQGDVIKPEDDQRTRYTPQVSEDWMGSSCTPQG